MRLICRDNARLHHHYYCYYCSPGALYTPHPPQHEKHALLASEGETIAGVYLVRKPKSILQRAKLILLETEVRVGL